MICFFFWPTVWAKLIKAAQRLSGAAGWRQGENTQPHRWRRACELWGSAKKDTINLLWVNQGGLETEDGSGRGNRLTFVETKCFHWFMVPFTYTGSLCSSDDRWRRALGELQSPTHWDWSGTSGQWSKKSFFLHFYFLHSVNAVQLLRELPGLFNSTLKLVTGPKSDFFFFKNFFNIGTTVGYKTLDAAFSNTRHSKIINETMHYTLRVKIVISADIHGWSIGTVWKVKTVSEQPWKLPQQQLPGQFMWQQPVFTAGSRPTSPLTSPAVISPEAETSGEVASRALQDTWKIDLRRSPGLVRMSLAHSGMYPLRRGQVTCGLIQCNFIKWRGSDDSCQTEIKKSYIVLAAILIEVRLPRRCKGWAGWWSGGWGGLHCRPTLSLCCYLQLSDGCYLGVHPKYHGPCGRLRCLQDVGVENDSLSLESSVTRRSQHYHLCIRITCRPRHQWESGSVLFF